MTESLLAGVADLQLTLNDSHRVASIASESALMRQLSRETLIGRPWLELISESDRTLASAGLEAASTTPGIAQRVDIHLNISIRIRAL